MVHGLRHIKNGNAKGKRRSAKMLSNVDFPKHARTVKKPNSLRLKIFTRVLVGTV